MIHEVSSKQRTTAELPPEERIVPLSIHRLLGLLSLEQSATTTLFSQMSRDVVRDLDTAAEDAINESATATGKRGSINGWLAIGTFACSCLAIGLRANENDSKLCFALAQQILPQGAKWLESQSESLFTRWQGLLRQYQQRRQSEAEKPHAYKELDRKLSEAQTQAAQAFQSALRV
jgi:hypothetical protein